MDISKAELTAFAARFQTRDKSVAAVEKYRREAARLGRAEVTNKGKVCTVFLLESCKWAYARRYSSARQRL